MSTEVKSVNDKGRAVMQQIQRIEADIEALDTQQGQQLNLMRRHFSDAATGWDWVREHQGDFEKEVFGPPMISCSIKDERYSNQVQALLQNDDFLCFTAQTRNDYKRLTDQLYRVLSLSVVIRTCSHSLETFQPPASHAEISALGLDGFAIDYLEGPSPVLAMLCAEKRIHQSGVALRDHNDAEYERLVNNGKVSQWAAGQHSYAVRRRREYGPQAMTTISRNIRPGRFWTSQPVDSQEKTELGRRLAELKGEKDVLAAEQKELKARFPTIEEKASTINERIVCCPCPSDEEYTHVFPGRLEERQECTAEGISEMAGSAGENR